MSRPTALFDRNALMKNRLRASSDPALFLHEAAADEIDERLKEVNRTFTDPVVVGGFKDPWSRFGPVVADNDVLDLREGAHDLVIHGFGLHWADDPVGQLVQCRRALKPDGLMIAVLFGGQTLHELRACLAEAETSITGGLSPRVIPMGEIRDLGGLLQRAGFALPVADSVTTQVEYQSAFHLMRDLRAMGETNAMIGRSRFPTRKSILFEMAKRYQAGFPGEYGRIRATFETIVLTGWAPSADQQQPLRPGSATTRLSEALGVPERDPEEAPK